MPAARCAARNGAGHVKRHALEALGINIPHRTIRAVMRESGDARGERSKTGRRRWVRYER